MMINTSKSPMSIYTEELGKPKLFLIDCNSSVRKDSFDIKKIPRIQEETFRDDDLTNDVNSSLQDEQQDHKYDRDALDESWRSERENQKQTLQQLQNEISEIIRRDEFIDGEISHSAMYIRSMSGSSKIEYVKSALMELYLKNFNDSSILEGLLEMVSSLSYDEAAPQGPIMALGLLTHKDLEIRDKAIQAYEKWNSPQALSTLKSIRCSPKWLQKYVDKVIYYIERNEMK